MRGVTKEQAKHFLETIHKILYDDKGDNFMTYEEGQEMLSEIKPDKDGSFVAQLKYFLENE